MNALAANDIEAAGPNSAPSRSGKPRSTPRETERVSSNS